VSLSDFLFPTPMMSVVYFTETAAIKSIPSGTNPDARTVVIASLKCTAPQELDDIERERAQMGTVYTSHRVFTEYHATAIVEGYRFVFDSVDYRIQRVKEMPRGDPYYLELMLNDET
jgi:hypothetical protein